MAWTIGIGSDTSSFNRVEVLMVKIGRITITVLAAIIAITCATFIAFTARSERTNN